jgi:hypothetical protein
MMAVSHLPHRDGAAAASGAVAGVAAGVALGTLASSGAIGVVVGLGAAGLVVGGLLGAMTGDETACDLEPPLPTHE